MQIKQEARNGTKIYALVRFTKQPLSNCKEDEGLVDWMIDCERI
jgi:hypothetical protein